LSIERGHFDVSGALSPCDQINVTSHAAVVHPTVCLPLAWRHHPSDAPPRCLLLAVVRSQISSPQSANGAATAALDVLQNFISLEATRIREVAIVDAGAGFLAVGAAGGRFLADAVPTETTRTIRAKIARTEVAIVASRQHTMLHNG
jgi:hypothetical protein